jgi:hypothetical protein
MTHALVTFLGRGRENPSTGYREATYRFPNGALCTTNFFGLALSRHLAADCVVILGTRSSMWGVLVEHAAAAGEEEDARIALMDAEDKGCVDQPLLDSLTPLLRFRKPPPDRAAEKSKSAASRRFVALSAARMKEWVASDLSESGRLVLERQSVGLLISERANREKFSAHGLRFVSIK